MIRNALRDRVDSHVILLVGLLIFEIGVFSILEPATYPTRANFTSMTLQASEIGLLALGIVLTMIVSGIDLSIVATANVAGIIAATTMTAMDGPSSSATATAIIVGVVIALAWGAAAGALNGTLVVGARVSPILVTLGTLTLFTGIGTAATEGKVVFGIDAFTWLGDGKIAGLAVPFLLLVALAVLLSLRLARTRFGFEAYLVGENARAAWFSGISVRRRQFAMYVASGMLSAVAGLVVLGRTNAAQVDFGQSFVLLAVLVAVLGGLDPYGGRGSPLGALLAVAVLQAMSTGLNQVLVAHTGSNFFKNFAWGILLIVVLAISQRSRTPRNNRKHELRDKTPEPDSHNTDTSR